jgi:hypothetical protein
MARRPAEHDEKQVRLNLQVFASENPLLVLELLKLRKGKLRHARLVTLATIGLLTEWRIAAGDASPAPAIGHAVAAKDQDDASRLPPLNHEQFVEIG